MLAYPLARVNFPGAGFIAFTVAATYLLPQPLLFIPVADIIAWASATPLPRSS
jgi:multiple sugar transport system permease protein